MRTTLRSGLIGALRTIGKALYAMHLARLIIWLRRRTPRVLVYHSCSQQEGGITAALHCYLPAHVFALHLDMIARYYNVTTVSEMESGVLPLRAAIVTFDDGHQSIYNEALPLMRRRNMRATVYLVTEVIGNQTLMWPHELQWFHARFGDSVENAIAEHCPGVPHDRSAFDLVNYLCDHCSLSDIADILVELRLRHEIDPEVLAADAGLYLYWSQIESLADAGFEFGCHTHKHPNCAQLSADAFRREVGHSSSLIRTHVPSPTSFAFPFGLSSAEVIATLPDLGFRSAAMLEEPATARGTALLGFSRVGTVAASEAAFFADLEVVAPVLALLRSARHCLFRAHDASHR